LPNMASTSEYSLYEDSNEFFEENLG